MVDASKCKVNDVSTGITNSDYLIAVLDEIGSKPAQNFIYDHTKECGDIDLIAYCIVLLDELEEDVIMSIAKKISFKDFLFVLINLLEYRYTCDDVCEKYETNIERIALELYLLDCRLNYQRLNKPLFQELFSVNYGTFHDTMYELIETYSYDSDKDVIEKLKKSGQKNTVKEGKLGEFYSYLHKTMNQDWCPNINIREYRGAVLNGYRMYLREFILPLAFGMNADILGSQTLEDVLKKYI